MKIMYTRLEDGGLSIVVPATKEAVEKVLGTLTDLEYKAHVWERSVPEGAINARYVVDEGIPSDREFRNAWCDTSPEAVVDIDLSKAKDLKLTELRAVRNTKLDKLDKEFMAALEKGEDLEGIKVKKQILRDFTEELKALPVEGVNDPEVLDMIRYLVTIPE